MSDRASETTRETPSERRRREAIIPSDRQEGVTRLARVRSAELGFAWDRLLLTREQRLEKALHRIVANSERTDASPYMLLIGCGIVARRALNDDD